MSAYGVDKFKLEQYEKLLHEICNCKNIDSAIRLIREAEKEIALYAKGYQDGQPKSTYGDR